MGKVNYDRRVYGLDVYRSIAIIIVVLGHSSFMLDGTAMESFPWIRLVDGVELFFVLSGFLIGTILIKTIHKEGYTLSGKTLINFWKRRWFRTLPNYYLVLIVYTLFVAYGIVDADISQFDWTFFFFLQNFASPFYDFFWESWSLSIEEWFYIITPLMLLMILKALPDRRGVLVIIITLIIAPLLYRIYHSEIIVDAFWLDVRFRKIVLMRLDTIIYGVLAAYIKFYYFSLWKRFTLLSFTAGVLGLLLIPNISMEPNTFFSKTFYFTLTSIAAMLIIPFADSVKDFKSKIGKSVTHISLTSYSMYLINLGLGTHIIKANFPVENPQDGAIKYILFWIYLMLSSTLLYYFFEKPMTSLRDKPLRSLFKK